MGTQNYAPKDRDMSDDERLGLEALAMMSLDELRTLLLVLACNETAES